jgi:hypothetical protein
MGKSKTEEPIKEETTQDNENVKPEPKVNESVDIHYVQLQNQVLAERADKEYYKNLVSSAIEYIDAEQTQFNNNRLLFKKALLNPPSVRTLVNPPDEKASTGTTNKLGKEQPKQEDNKKKKTKK